MTSARDELLAALTAERYNGGGWKTPPKHWNAASLTSALAFNDDDVTRARRRREALAEWEAHQDEEVAK